MVSRFGGHVSKASDMVRGWRRVVLLIVRSPTAARGRGHLAGGARGALPASQRDKIGSGLAQTAAQVRERDREAQQVARHGIKQWRRSGGVVGQRDERCAVGQKGMAFTPGCRAGQRGRRASRQPRRRCRWAVAVVIFHGGEEGLPRNQKTAVAWRYGLNLGTR